METGLETEDGGSWKLSQLPEPGALWRSDPNTESGDVKMYFEAVDCQDSLNDTPDAFYKLLREAVVPHLPCTKLVIYFTLKKSLSIEIYSNTTSTTAPRALRVARRAGFQWFADGSAVDGALHDGATLYTQHVFGGITQVASYMANALTLVFAPMRPETPFCVTFSWSSKVYSFTVSPWNGIRIAENLKTNFGSFFGDLVCVSTGPWNFTWRSRLELGLQYVGKSCIVTDVNLAKIVSGPVESPKQAPVQSMLQFTPPRPKAKIEINEDQELHSALAHWFVV